MYFFSIRKWKQIFYFGILSNGVSLNYVKLNKLRLFYLHFVLGMMKIYGMKRKDSVFFYDFQFIFSLIVQSTFYCCLKFIFIWALNDLSLLIKLNILCPSSFVFKFSPIHTSSSFSLSHMSLMLTNFVEISFLCVLIFLAFLNSLCTCFWTLSFEHDYDDVFPSSYISIFDIDVSYPSQQRRGYSMLMCHIFFLIYLP